jgi:hypothetical protein
MTAVPQNVNPGFLEYETGGLITRLRRSVLGIVVAVVIIIIIIIIIISMSSLQTTRK